MFFAHSSSHNYGISLHVKDISSNGANFGPFRPKFGSHFLAVAPKKTCLGVSGMEIFAGFVQRREFAKRDNLPPIKFLAYSLYRF